MKTTHQHTCTSFSPESTVPNAWQQNLECRVCKRSIVEAIGLSFLQTGKFMSHPNQAIVLAGCFSGEGEDNAWVILPGDTSIPEPSPQYRSTAEEADNCIWRHATQCSGNKVLIYSPDTDVYNIGLALLHGTPNIYSSIIL